MDASPPLGPFYAHTPPEDDLTFTRFQTMRRHIRNVARLASCFAAQFGAQEQALWTAWLHDVGKYCDPFQDYLIECNEAEKRKRGKPKAGKVDHKCAGTKLALETLPVGKTQIEIGQIVAACVLGHHGGLNPIYSSEQAVMQAKQDQVQQAIANAYQDWPYIKGTPPTAIPGLDVAMSETEQGLYLEMFTRMLFSCLVDADSLDTERHGTKEKSALRRGPKLSKIGPVWLSALMTKQDELQAKAKKDAEDQKDGNAAEVNRIRAEVYEHCKTAATLPPGVFSLTVPTGGGKTRSSLAFALMHALAHKRTRIIYAIPYTSIVDQTALEFRRILGKDGILEHHSAIDTIDPDSERTAGTAQEEKGREQRRRLASQNWAAPLVVTTTVQLFESLFSNRTSRCRKLHNLVNSVIVLDEVQTLPLTLLTPLLSGLKALRDHYGVTVVLCTATQPPFGKDTPYLKGLSPIVPIIPDPEPYFRQLKRVSYHVEKEEWTWEETAARMKAHGASCLAVLNTKKDALALLGQFKEIDTSRVFHLSTLLCGAHRRMILANIREGLKKPGELLYLISTQVVEAGVDLDFHYVYRAKGPLERLIQAAGRCNREGKRSVDASKVIIFDPIEGRMPSKDYETQVKLAWEMITAEDGFDFDAPDASTNYFSELYASKGRKWLDKKSVQEDREACDFPTVARKVRFFEDDTIPVLVPFHRGECPESPISKVKFEKVVERIRGRIDSRKGLTGNMWRRLQPYLVAIPARDAEPLYRTVLSWLVEDELYLWEGEYSWLTGIGNNVEREPGDLII